MKSKTLNERGRLKGIVKTPEGYCIKKIAEFTSEIKELIKKHEKELQESEDALCLMYETNLKTQKEVHKKEFEAQSEDYNRKLDIAEAEHKKEMQESWEEGVKAGRKETAWQIFADLERTIKRPNCVGCYFIVDLKELKKKYGVENGITR